jgi:hypothetical protein
MNIMRFMQIKCKIDSLFRTENYVSLSFDWGIKWVIIVVLKWTKKKMFFIRMLSVSFFLDLNLGNLQFHYIFKPFNEFQ